MIKKDVALVGAGPIGLEVAVALKNAGIDYVHFDKGQIGSTITWFPRQMRFFSSPDRLAISGVPIPRTDEYKCTREEYLAYLRSIVLQFELDINTYEKVQSMEKSGNTFRIKTQDFQGENEYNVQKVILVTGDTHKARMLDIPGENLPNVSHYFDEPHKYFGRKLLVVGGKNSAVEAALKCYQTSSDVAISYRRGEFDPKSVKWWLLPEINNLTKRKKIAFYNNTIPVEILPGAVKLKQVETDKIITVNIDFVLLLVGYVADMGLLKEAGVKLKKPNNKPQFNRNTMETNVPGLYVAGTATAGTQERYKVFIENCHIHVKRIIASLQGASPPEDADPFGLPES